MNKLEAAIILSEEMRLIGLSESAISVADQNGIILAFVPAAFMLKTSDFKLPKVGDHVAQGSLLGKSLLTHKPVSGSLPKNILGIKAKTQAFPLFDDSGYLVGAIAATTSMEKQDALHNAAVAISSTAKEITDATEELGHKAVNISEEMSKVKDLAENILLKANKTDEILEFVQEIALNSNLLGINAAIEAVHAGDKGKGFSVVADEIRKMAAKSENAVREIEKMLIDIKKAVMLVTESVSDSINISQQHTAKTQQIMASMMDLSSSIFEVERISEVV